MSAIVFSVPSMSSYLVSKDQHGGSLSSRRHATPVQDPYTTSVDPNAVTSARSVRYVRTSRPGRRSPGGQFGSGAPWPITMRAIAAIRTPVAAAERRAVRTLVGRRRSRRRARRHHRSAPTGHNPAATGHSLAFAVLYQRQHGHLYLAPPLSIIQVPSLLAGGFAVSWGLPRFAIMRCLAGSLVLAIVLLGTAHPAAALGSSGVHLVSPLRMAGSGEPVQASLLLGRADLPAGFQPYTPLTGPLDAKRGQVVAIVANQYDLEHGWVRDWRSASTGQQVIEVVIDEGTREAAKADTASFDSAMLKSGRVREPISGPAHLVSFRATVQLEGIDWLVLTLSMARGPYYFGLHVFAPVQSSASASLLMSKLAAAQWQKVPDNTPDTVPSNADIVAQAQGGVIGFLLAYFGIVNGIAYLRNPLRGARKRARSQLAQRRPAKFETEDVSGRASNTRSMAQLRLGAQGLGGLIVLNGADPSRSPHWYVYLVAGSITMWAAGRYIQPDGFGRARNRVILAGRRRFRVAGMLSSATVLIILGFLSLFAGALVKADPQPQGTAAVQDPGQVLLYIGIALVAVGAICHRGARRLGSIEAHRLMLRDTRPAVLYLRSFGDDGLKLWTATLGRLSFIERFTPVRFDAFEEVLARHLSFIGPVIALNPPGTGLSPLGAARETVDSADWRSTIAAWMDKSALIVFVAPPGQVTPGLLWELETVSTHGHWAKTLIVVPPVQPGHLEWRWNAFLYAAGRLWPFTVRLPVEDPRALVLAFRNNAWAVITADRRTEWSYGAALHQACARFGSGQGLLASGSPTR